MEESIGFNCARYIGSLLAAILGLVAFVSPIVMVGLPKLGIKVKILLLKELTVLLHCRLYSHRMNSDTLSDGF